ncbi:MAG: class F sortase [Chloroflexi bacterium]|nr:class F sortase [Chloroflexota bacterium]
MSRKLAPWLQIVLVIASLLVGQVQSAFGWATLSAVPAPGDAAVSVDEDATDPPDAVVGAEPDVDVGGMPPRQGAEPHNECRLEVNTYLLEEGATPVALTSPDPPPNIRDTEPADGVAPSVQTKAGDELLWLMIIENTSAEDTGEPGDCPDGGYKLGALRAWFYFSGYTDDTIERPPLSYTVAHMYEADAGDINYSDAAETGFIDPGEFAWTYYNYTVQPNIIGSHLWVQSEVHANVIPEDSVSDAFADELDNDYLELIGGGFTFDEFSPNVTMAVPGTQLTYTLRVTASRPGVPIGYLRAFSVEYPEVAAACGQTSQWINTITLQPVSESNPLNYEEQAECRITGAQSIVIPTEAPPQTFFVTATVEGAQNSSAIIIDMTRDSDQVEVIVPQISVTKTVTRITRNGIDVPLPGPAASGDVIEYRIEVKNTGDVDLGSLTIVDSLTGVLGTGLSLPLANPQHNVTTTYTVRPDNPDPLNNRVDVTALAAGQPVRASAVAAVDIAESGLQVQLLVTDLDAEPGQPAGVTRVGHRLRYEVIASNVGNSIIRNLKFEQVAYPQQSVGMPLPAPAIVPSTLSVSEVRTLATWQYVVTDADDDPLTSTIRLQGTAADNRLVYSQAQATIDITVPGLSLGVQLIAPAAEAALRGGSALYEVTVSNTDSVADLCNVVVDQYRRDPQTGIETRIATNIPLAGVTGGQLPADTDGVAQVTYLITGVDKDPLHMIFEVNATVCDSGTQLTDRNSHTLDLSDAQVNAQITPIGLGATPEGALIIGQPVRFEYQALNVGTVTLTELEATYCFLSRATEEGGDAYCNKPFALSRTEIASFDEHASGQFPVVDYLVRPEDADADPFAVEVILTGTDNQDKRVSLRTVKTLSVVNPLLLLTVNGPGSVVSGDVETFSFTATNNSDSGEILTSLQLFNLNVSDTVPIAVLNPDPADFDGTLDPNESYQGEFEYTIPDVTEGVLPLQVRAIATDQATGASVISNVALELQVIPILRVLKTGPEGKLPVDQEIVYSITIKNQSKQQTVTFTDFEDNVLEAYGIPYDLGVGPFPTSLGPGEEVTQLFTLPSIDPDLTPNPVTNVFTAYGTRQSDNSEVFGSDDHTFEIACPIEVFFNVTNEDEDDPDYTMGEELRWTITYRNTTSQTLTNVMVTEPLGSQSWSGTLGPGENRQFLPFVKYIDGSYYKSDPDVMADQVTATFEMGGEQQTCISKWEVPLFSPIQVFKVPNTFFAFTGDTIEYSIYLENIAEDDHAPYHRFYITGISDNLLGTSILLDKDDTGPEPAVPAFWLEPGERYMPITTPTDLTYVVQETDPDKLVNTVTVEFRDPIDANQTWFTQSEAEVITVNPIEIRKVPSATQAFTGDTITYDYTITNISTYLVAEIVVLDDKLGTIVPPDPPLNLLPGESFVVEDVPYLIKPTDPDPLVNTVTGTAVLYLDASTPRPFKLKPVTAAVDLQDPAVTVTKWVRNHGTGVRYPEDVTGTQEVGDGDLVDFCFLVENHTDILPDTPVLDRPYVDDILLNDETIPMSELQTQFEAAVMGIGPENEPTPRRLYAQQSVEFCYVAVAPEPETGFPITRDEYGDPAVNRVRITGLSSTGEQVDYAYDLEMDILGSRLSISKVAAPNVAYVGQEVQYTITVRNRLTEDTGATITLDEVTDAFAEGVPVPIPFDDPGWDWTAANRPPGSTEYILGPQGFITYSYNYTVQLGDPDPLVNIAEVRGTLGAEELVDQTRNSVAVTASQLLVRKRATPNVAFPGDTVHYEVSITNIGDTPVQAITVLDQGGSDPTPVDRTGLLPFRDLGPFESVFFSYDATMPTAAILATQPDLDPYINTLTATGTVWRNNKQEQVSTTVTEEVDILQPGVRITKSPQVNAAAPNSTVMYDITVTNIGDDDSILQQIVVTDVTSGIVLDLADRCATPASCPFSYTAVSSEPGGNPLAGQPYNPTRGLLRDEQITGTIEVTVPADVGAQFTNIASVEARNVEAEPLETDELRDVQDSTSATIEIRDEGVEVVKTASAPSGVVGDEIEYTLAITNISGGSTSFNRVVVADAALPAPGYVTLQGTNPTTGLTADGVLDPGETVEYKYPHTLAAEPDPYVNRVTVTAYGGIVSARDTAQTTVDVLQADIGVEKFACVGDTFDADFHLTPGNFTDPVLCPQAINVADGNEDVVTYFIRVFNASPAAALENVEIHDSLVADADLGTITWPDAARPGVLDALGDAENEDEVWHRYTYTVPAGAPDPLTNTVSVAGDAIGLTPVQHVTATAAASIDLVTSDLRLSKTVAAQADPFEVGDMVTYQLQVQNLGSSPIANVQIIDPLYAGAGHVVCTINPLASGATYPAQPGDDCTFTHTITATDPNPLVNRATASGMQGGVMVSDSATYMLYIASEGLRVSKTANPIVAQVGDEITYTYVIENVGNEPIDLLTVNDSDPNITFTPAWPDVLAPGATETRTVLRRLEATDLDPYVNTITVDGWATLTERSVYAEANASVAIVEDSSQTLVVTNVPNRQFARPGESVTFAYTARNLGTTELTQVMLSDNEGAFPDTYTLPPNGSITVYRTVTVTPEHLPGPLSYTVVATDGTMTDMATAEVPLVAGDLLVTKTATPSVIYRSEVASGGSVTIDFVVDITNLGTETLESFTVDDVMSPDLGLTLMDAPPTTLVPNQTVHLVGSITIPQADLQTLDLITNTVTARGTGVTTQVEQVGTASASVAIVEDTNVRVILTAEVIQTETTPPRPDTDITYRYTIRNLTNDVITGVELFHDPGGQGDVQVPLLHPIDGTPIDTLQPRQSISAPAIVTIPADWTEPSYATEAYLRIGGTDEPSITITTSPIQLLTVAKAVTSPTSLTAVIGDTVEYAIQIVNLSTAEVSGVEVVDTFNGAVTDALDPAPDGTIAGSATETFTLSVVVTDQMQSPLTNSVTVEVDDVPMGTDAAEEVTISTVGLEVSNVSIVQAGAPANPGLLRTDIPASVRFTLRNTSTDTEVTALDYDVSFSGGINTAAGSLTCNTASLPPTIAVGATHTNLECQITGMPQAGDSDYAAGAMDLTATVEVTGTASGNPVSSDPVTASAEFVDVVLDVTLEIARASSGDPDDPILPGEDVLFTLTLTNRGASQLGCDSTVPATMPCHFTFTIEGEDQQPTDPNVGVVLGSWDNTLRNLVLASGESSTLTRTVTAGTDVAEATRLYTIIVTGGWAPNPLGGATADDLEYYEVSDSATATLLFGEPEIAVFVAVSPANPIVGSPVQFTVTIQNTGAVAVTDLEASYRITTGTTSNGIMLTSGKMRPASQTSGEIALNATTLEPNGSTVGTLVKGAEDQTQPYTFTVEVNGVARNLSILVSETASVQVRPQLATTPTPTPTGTLGTGTPGLDPAAIEPIVTKTANAQAAQAGAALDWTITVRNGGTAVMPNVTITDTVAENMQLVSAVTSRGTVVVEGQNLRATTGILNPGDTVTITVNTTVAATVMSPSSLANTACAQRDGGVQVCTTATVNVGPGVANLPATGIGAVDGSDGWDRLLGVALCGALMLLFSAQVSNRRMLFAGLFVAVAVLAVVIAVVLSLSGGDEDDPQDDPQLAAQEGTPAAVASQDAPADSGAMFTPSAPGAFPVPPTATPYVRREPSGPRSISIPKLGEQFSLPVPIVDVPIANRQWDVSGLGYYVGWLEGTTWLESDWGNTVLAAHVQLGTNNPGPFWGLGDLVPGDEIIVSEGEQDFRFQVQSVRKVDPSDWTVTAPTNGPTLTLITCTEWDRSRGVFSQRMVIQAVPLMTSG